MLIRNRKDNMYENLRNSIQNADEIIMNVSFIRDSGMKLLSKDLLKAKDEGKKIKILTSNYMNITEPNALYRILNLNIDETKIFDNKENISFHPKTYIFRKGKEVEVYIGSSNISYSALVSGEEWNYHFKGSLENKDIQDILTEFEELYDKNSFYLTLDWLRNYEKTFVKKDIDMLIDPKPYEEFNGLENSEREVVPIKFQIPALYELSRTREEGYKKAMVVVGTGLGKTYLSAFDSLSFERVLFVAHRDEILRDARKTFETVHKDRKSYGFFNGYQKEREKDVVFASVNTLSKSEYLNEEYFSPEYFDYIVIDEFHHSSATSYQKILDYFKPKFLLGLTATPERADNGDVYKLCDYNIAYECDFRVGINNGWLSPFEYFGIYDDTDYSTIPWRSGKYDLEILENSLIVEKRMELVYKKYMEYRKKFTIGFCASVKHCKFMNRYFSERGIKSEIIIGDTSFSKRQEIIEKFKKGEIEIIFTVDVFNEGVDIPCIDTILFLRPTNSYTIFIQQLGRGLRIFEGKEKLRVLDFVGNYRGAELKTNFLIGKSSRNLKSGEKIISPLDNDFILPSGCTANFDFKVIEYFEERKNRKDNLKEKIVQEFLEIKERLGKTPEIMEIYTFGEIPVHTYLQKYRTWYGFLKEINELSEIEKNYSQKAIDFLQFLEKTSMTKSYKIPLLLSLFQNGIRKEISLEEIGKFYKTFYSDELHGKDLNNKKHNEWRSWNLKKFESLAESNPIFYLTDKGKNSEFFTYEIKEKKFILDEKLFQEIKNCQQLLKNILDRLSYRNINYFRRKYMEGECQ